MHKTTKKLCAQIHIMPTDFMCVTTILLVQLIHGTCIDYYVLQEYKKTRQRQFQKYGSNTMKFRIAKNILIHL